MSDAPPADPVVPSPQSGGPASPATPAGAPAPGAPAATGDRSEGGVDKQLVALAVGLWILAAIVIGMKWTRMRVDWHVGNLHKTFVSTGGKDDPDTVASLVELAQEDPASLTALRDEVLGSQRQRPHEDPFFRGAIVRVVARVRGDGAANVLHQVCVLDPHPFVRANAFDGLGDRAVLVLGTERDYAIRAGLNALAIPGEPDVLARGYAARMLGRLSPGPEAVWPVLRAFRDTRLPDVAPPNEQEAALRARFLEAEALKAIVGEGALPLDPAADQATRDAQVRAWEAWIVASGSTIPAGEKLDEVFGSVAPAGSATPQTAGPPAGTPEEQQR